ncbi:MAG: flavin reductase family protein [Dehalococcoidia bacterium]
MTESDTTPPAAGRSRPIDPIEQVMLALSYGVHVVGSRAADGTLNAMLADWVMQVSFRPRLVAVSIENDARTLRFIRETGACTINLLHEKDGLEIARKVVMPAEGRKIRNRSPEAAATIHGKLAGIPFGVHENGCAVLDRALGWFACAAQSFVPAGDHTLVIGEVTDGAVLRAGEMLIERDLGWEYAG